MNFHFEVSRVESIFISIISLLETVSIFFTGVDLACLRVAHRR